MSARSKSMHEAGKAGTARIGFAVMLFACALMALGAHARAESLAERFAAHDPDSDIAVDYAAWDTMLKAHVKPDGHLNRVDYAAWKRSDGNRLLDQINRLEQVEVGKLSRPEQFAYWVNLYNAVTVALILKHYPVESIRDIDISPGFFADGPWGAKLVTVGGVELSLDNIEHDILRENWDDPRVHYAVNCASVGCPNLKREAYTGARLDAQLNAAARDYIASPRGVRFEGSGVSVSRIYDWYEEDFGGTEAGVLEHLRDYAGQTLAKRLSGLSAIDDYEYDWSLNDVRR